MRRQSVAPGLVKNGADERYVARRAFMETIPSGTGTQREESGEVGRKEHLAARHFCSATFLSTLSARLGAAEVGARPSRAAQNPTRSKQGFKAGVDHAIVAVLLATMMGDMMR